MLIEVHGAQQHTPVVRNSVDPEFGSTHIFSLPDVKDADSCQSQDSLQYFEDVDAKAIATFTLVHCDQEDYLRPLAETCRMVCISWPTAPTPVITLIITKCHGVA